MKVYIKYHKNFAGKWIYKGFASAWKRLGYDVEYYESLEDVDDKGHYIMAIDYDLKNKDKLIQRLDTLESAEKVFLYSQPNVFPEPWGAHDNFVSIAQPEAIKKINSFDHVTKWSWLADKKYYTEWENVNTVLLAHDSENYEPMKDDDYKFDVCFVGGWADNGFNEKKRIMLNHFIAIKKLKLNCGIFVNKNIPHSVENKILYNSKIAINIHDNYQRILGLDINERTFKSLGLTGFLISDHIECMKNIFPNVPLAKDAEEMANLIEEHISKDISEVKEKNREDILKNHTYKNRVRELLLL